MLEEIFLTLNTLLFNEGVVSFDVVGPTGYEFHLIRLYPNSVKLLLNGSK